MLTLKRVSCVTFGVGLAVVVGGCAADSGDPIAIEPDDSTEAGLELEPAAVDPVLADEFAEAEGEVGSTTEALRAVRGGAVRGGVVRGGAVRGGVVRGGAVRGGWARGTYRGGVVYGAGGVVYGAGGVFRAGRYRSGGVWVTCDAFGACW